MKIIWTTMAGAGVLSSVVLAIGMAACSSDDASSPLDSGLAEASGPPDSSADGGRPEDTGVPDAGPALPPASVVLVNAAADDALALRFCFALGGRIQPLPAVPDRAAPGQPYPGIYPGSGGPVPQDEGTELGAFDVTVYGILATSIRSDTADADAGQKDCQQLLPTLNKNVDYWDFAKIPKATLTRGTSWLLAVTGNGTGNLQLHRFPLERLGEGGNAPAFQFLHLSSQAEGRVAPNGLYPAVMTTLKPDAGGTTVSLGGPIRFAQAPLAARRVEGLDLGAGAFAVLSDGPDAGGSSLGGQPPLPIQVAEAYTVGPGQPEYIQNGKTYTVVYLGDPETSPPPNAAPGTAGHFLVFPNDPTR